MAYLQRQKRVKKCTRHGATVPEKRSEPNVGSLDGAAVELKSNFSVEYLRFTALKSLVQWSALASVPFQHLKCWNMRDKDEKGYNCEKCSNLPKRTSCKANRSKSSHYIQTVRSRRGGFLVQKQHELQILREEMRQQNGCPAEHKHQNLRGVTSKNISVEADFTCWHCYNDVYLIIYGQPDVQPFISFHPEPFTNGQFPFCCFFYGNTQLSELRWVSLCCR